MDNKIYERLKITARANRTIAYGELALLASLDMELPIHRKRLGDILGEISAFEHERGRPLMSAVVVHKENNMPGSGFFKLAKQLGIYIGGDDLGFFVRELKKVHEYWSAKRSSDD